MTTKPKPRGLRRYDKRKKTAVIEVIVPGTKGKTRRQKVVEVEQYTDIAGHVTQLRRETMLEFPNAPWPDRPTDLPSQDEAPREPRTLRAYVAAEWKDSLALRLSKGRESYERAIVDNHLLPHFGDTRLDQITIKQVDTFIADMRKKNRLPTKFRPSNPKVTLSAPFINSAVRVLLKILHRAVRYGELRRMPFAQPIEWLEEKALRQEFTDQERLAFLRAFHDRKGYERVCPKGNTDHFARFSRAYPLFLCALHTGLRRDDLRLLEWRSVNLASGTIERVTQKHQSQVALIALSEPLGAALTHLRKQHPRVAYVFVTERGRPYSVTTIQRYFLIAKKIAGVDRRMRLHDLRHSFGSALASHGASLPVIAANMGHASTRTTQRYAKVSAEAIAATTRAFSADPIPDSMKSPVKTNPPKIDQKHEGPEA